MLKKNSLVFTPAGLGQEITIQFPRKSRSLLVCKKCKKNYKSREICRSNSGHTSLPWNVVYLCIVIDDSCLTSNSSTCKKEFITDGKLSGRVIENQEFEMKKKSFNSSLPVCKSCKQKNYTRSYCRNQKKHLHLPWNTDYVVLSKTNNSTTVTSDDVLFKEKSSTGTSNNMATICNKENEIAVDEKQDNIHDIDDSRVFLLAVSCYSSSLYWLQPNDDALKTSLQCSAWDPSIIDQENEDAYGYTREGSSSLRSENKSSTIAHNICPTSNPYSHTYFSGYNSQNNVSHNYYPPLNYQGGFSGSVSGNCHNGTSDSHSYYPHYSQIYSVPPQHNTSNYHSSYPQDRYFHSKHLANEQHVGEKMQSDNQSYENFENRSSMYPNPTAYESYNPTFYNSTGKYS